jgi:Domain of unknown function (DUF4357)
VQGFDGYCCGLSTNTSPQLCGSQPGPPWTARWPATPGQGSGRAPLGVGAPPTQLFDSPSTAAGIVLGRSANGRIEWKSESGETLKKMQEAALHETIPSSSSLCSP